MSRGRPATPLGTMGNVAVRAVGGGKFQASAYYRTSSGKMVRVRATGRSKTAAMNAVKEKCRDKDAETHFQGISSTSAVTQLLDFWLPRHQVSERTKHIYRKAIDLHITPEIGLVRLNELTTPRIQEFLDSRTPAIAKTCRAVLSNAIGQAVRWGVMVRNPIRDTTLPKRQKVEVCELTDKEIKGYRAAVKAWCGGNQMGPKRGAGILEIVDVLIGSGMRIGECLALRWQDVDFDAGTVTILGTVDNKGGRADRPKTVSSRRTIYVTESALEALRRQWNKEARPYLGEAVFPTVSGGYLTVQNVEARLRQARGKEYEYITPHSFRKTVATRIERKYGALAAARHMGHSSTVVTESAYLARPEVQDNYTVAFGVGVQKVSKK